MNAHHLRIDASVIVSLAAAGLALAAALAYVAANASPSSWIAAAVLALVGIIWTVTAYINAKTAWLNADTARIYAKIADRQRNA